MGIGVVPEPNVKFFSPVLLCSIADQPVNQA
jgi:hypothetical protein